MIDIRAITELIQELRSGKGSEEEVQEVALRLSRGSIARKANDAVLQFPVIVSGNLAVDTMTMINRALEREYASFVMLAMGLDNVVDAEDFDKRKFIQKYHQNVGTRRNMSILTSTDPLDTNFRLEQTNLSLNRPYNEDLRVDTLNEKTTKGISNRYILGEAGTGNDMSSANDKTARSFSRNNGKDSIVSTEYKKANDLVPTVLNIGLTATGTGNATQIDLMVGVKTISHPVPSEEIVNNLATAVENDRLILRTIQWTTGEIKFFKDYLFMVDHMKHDALQNRSNSRWWRTLKSRSRHDKVRRALLSKKQILPNATIIITMEEVEEIKNRFGIDMLSNINAVRTLMDKFFLLGFVVADSSSDMAYFYFDGQRDYQTFSYASLERENTSSNNEVRSLVNMMNSMR